MGAPFDPRPQEGRGGSPREPHPNTVRVVMAVIFGLIALILALNAAFTWNAAQGIGAALLGLTNRYAALAMVEGAGSLAFGAACALSARAAYRYRDKR